MRIRPDLLEWQWQSYPREHRDRLNLMAHLVTVPTFIAGTLGFVRLAGLGLWSGAGLAAVVSLVALVIQRFLDRREATPAPAYAGVLDAVSRAFAEQFVTFPRFVLTGGWFRAMIQTPRSGADT